MTPTEQFRCILFDQRQALRGQLRLQVVAIESNVRDCKKYENLPTIHSDIDSYTSTLKRHIDRLSQTISELK